MGDSLSYLDNLLLRLKIIIVLEYTNEDEMEAIKSQLNWPLNSRVEMRHRHKAYRRNDLKNFETRII